MNQFKQFIPFRHNYGITLSAGVSKQMGDQLQDMLHVYAINDPAGLEYERIGFLGNPAGDMFYANESALLIMVAMRTRVLPASVVKAEAEKRAKEIEIAQGYKPGRKQMKEIKEEAVDALLPKAFIRETRVPVIFRKNWAFICTSSSARADAVAGLLVRALGEGLETVAVERAPVKFLTELAHEGDFELEDHGVEFIPGEAITLDGTATGKGIVRITRELSAGKRVSELISTGYAVSQLEMSMGSLGEELTTSFTVNANLAVRGIKIEGTANDAASNDADDQRSKFDNDLTLAALTFNSIIKNLVIAMGGLLDDGEMPDTEDAAPASSEFETSDEKIDHEDAEFYHTVDDENYDCYYVVTPDDYAAGFQLPADWSPVIKEVYLDSEFEDRLELPPECYVKSSAGNAIDDDDDEPAGAIAESLRNELDEDDDDEL